MNYEVTEKMEKINNLKALFILALGRVGIYLPDDSRLDTILFCVYFYYMFNLFEGNNSNWKEKYLPLDGTVLTNFVENRLDTKLNERDELKYRDLANEIEEVIVRSTDKVTNRSFSRGLLHDFDEYRGATGNSTTLQEYKTITQAPDVPDNVLSNTLTLLEKLILIWKWKNQTLEGAKRIVDKNSLNPMLNDEALLNDILRTLESEPAYQVPDLIVPELKIVESVNNTLGNFKYPYTIYTYSESSINYYGSQSLEYLKLIPIGWQFKVEVDVKGFRHNTNLLLFKYRDNYFDYGSSEYQNDRANHNYYDKIQYNLISKDTKANWNLDKNRKISLEDITVKDDIIITNTDKYDEKFFKKDYHTYLKRYLDWKPEVFLYSKEIYNGTPVPIQPESKTASINPIDSPIDKMNILEVKDKGNLGLTILVPELVEKFMKESCPSVRINNLSDIYSRRWYTNNSDYFYMADYLRDKKTTFLIGIYPVDENNKIIYEDPIVFTYYNKYNITEDLGVSFARYRAINNAVTKNVTLEKQYYPIKLGQMFYRNEWSRLSTERTISRLEDNNPSKKPIPVFTDPKIGDKSKNLLYLYGRDNYMPYIGRTSIESDQNFNITNPDDNTNITTINLPDNIEYIFKKYGNTKIALQMYMCITDMDPYFKELKSTERNGESYNITNKTLKGDFYGLPYYLKEGNRSVIVGDENKVLLKDIDKPNTPSKDRSLNNTYLMNYVTEPVIIDCDKSTVNSAPWLDRKYAPYIDKVVINESCDLYNAGNSLGRIGNESLYYLTLNKGIYIRIPNNIDSYLNGTITEKDVSDYDNYYKTTISDKNRYGKIKKDKYIIAIKNALIGILFNYSPVKNGQASETFEGQTFKEVSNNIRLYRNFDIIEFRDELYLYFNPNVEDLKYAGLGKYGTVKLQLLFKNEFFRNDDPDSPLNYNYVPITGDVQLLREVAGQRIKLYRGGILTHPTEYRNKNDRYTRRSNFLRGKSIYSLDLNNTSESKKKRTYTLGFPSYSLDRGVTIVDENNNTVDFIDDNTVYDMISIEMDYLHWQGLQIDNFKAPVVSSLETSSSSNGLLIPINITDMENFDFFKYELTGEISTYNSRYNSKINITSSYSSSDSFLNEDIKMLNFWYHFRPKVRFVKNGTNIDISVESIDIWKDRIKRENREYFNRDQISFFELMGDGKFINNGDSLPYYSSHNKDDIIDIDDLFCVRALRSERSISLFDKRTGLNNLYDLLVNIIVNAKVVTQRDGKSYTSSIQNIDTIKSKFGGYILDKLLMSDWVFTYRQGDNPDVDKIMRQAANDTGLKLLESFFLDSLQIAQGFDYSIGNVYDKFDNLLNKVFKQSNSYYQNILEPESRPGEVALMTPGYKRLVYFPNNDSNTFLYGFIKNQSTYNGEDKVFNLQIEKVYKGDNKELPERNNPGIRRGYKIGNTTPDNPFMGFSMPATSNIEDVPDHIHLVYCDIIWRDFDKSPENTSPNFGHPMTFSMQNSKRVVVGSSSSINLRYDFEYIKNKFKLDQWKAKGKHVIFRLLTDVPSKEEHKDCPDYIRGSAYDNEYGKGYSPNITHNYFSRYYIFAVLAFTRWLRENANYFNNFLYTVELPLGINGNGCYIDSRNDIVPINNVREIYENILSTTDPNILGTSNLAVKYVIGASVDVYSSEGSKFYAGWSCSNLGIRKDFNRWLDYNMLGSDNIMRENMNGALGASENEYYYLNKFKHNNSYTAAFRNDLDQDELMKPDNFRELLYQMKTITPLYVIGYVDKRKYPKQYELLMNEMGYKYSITGCEIKDGIISLYHSNEGKNAIQAISNMTTIKVVLTNKDGSEIYNSLTYQTINRNSNTSLNETMFSNENAISSTYINTGDVLFIRQTNPKEKTIIKVGKTLRYSEDIGRLYGDKSVKDIYLRLEVSNEFTSSPISINLGNLNRGKFINLTDNNLLNAFIKYTDDNGNLKSWLEHMYLGNLKMGQDGWI